MDPLVWTSHRVVKWIRDIDLKVGQEKKCTLNTETLPVFSLTAKENRTEEKNSCESRQLKADMREDLSLLNLRKKPYYHIYFYSWFFVSTE